MTDRRLQLLLAGVFLLGVACFVAGFVVNFTVSNSVGSVMALVGVVSAGGSRLLSRRRGLPAP